MVRCRVGRREKGAVAVETALVSMLLVSLLWSVVEISFLFRDSMVVSAASRAGARMASSLPRTNFADQTRAQVQDALTGTQINRVTEVLVYKASVDGSGKPLNTIPATCAANCWRYVPASGTLAQSGGSGWTASSQNACVTTQDYVGVTVRYSYPTRIGLFNNKALQEQTVMRLEPVTTGTCS